METLERHRVSSGEPQNHSRIKNWGRSSDLLYSLKDVKGPPGEPIAKIIDPDEKLARDTVANSLTFADGH